MGEYRNVTTLEGIEVTGWEESSLPPERLILDAECAEPRDEIKTLRYIYPPGKRIKVLRSPWCGDETGSGDEIDDAGRPD